MKKGFRQEKMKGTDGEEVAEQRLRKEEVERRRRAGEGELLYY